MKKSTLVGLPNSISHYKYYLLLITIIFFVFANSIGNGYNMDDNLVTQNHILTSKKELSTVIDIFTSPYYQDNMGYSYGYRPIVMLSFFLEHYIFGQSSLVSHLFNLFLYTIGVIFFYRLLIGWFGDKGLVLALLSGILFAIHPIHTEVVDSIKNRDEILAFIFVTLAGLSIERYLKKNTWISILIILVFFAFGMLSKKSIFPMVLIFPMVVIFFKEINPKQLAFVSTALIIPGAIIGSDFQIERLILLTNMAIGGIFLIYYLKTDIQISKEFNKEYLKYIPSFITWIFATIAIWKQNYGYFLLVIPFFLLLIKNKQFCGVFQFVLQLALIGFFLNIIDPLVISIIISTGFLTYSIFNGKLDRGFLILSILVFVLFLFVDFNIIKCFLAFLLVIFFYITFKKALLGLLLAIIAIVVSVFFFNIGLFHILLFIFSTIYFISSRGASSTFIYNMSSIALVLSLIYIFIQLNNHFQLNNTVSGSSIEQKSNPINIIQNNTANTQGLMKEGRRLEYVENTLVDSHTLAETIGTGFITIDTYFKLMVCPKELSFYYGYSKIKTTGLNNIWVWGSIVFYLGLILLAIWQANKRPIITIGVVWFVLSILLFSNWTELVAGMVGERLAFTASAGFSIFMAGVILWIKPGFSFSKPKGVEYVVFTILLLLAVRTFARNADWKDPITLMSHDIKHLGNSAQANNLYAIFLMKKAAENNQLSKEEKQNYRLEGIEHFKKALSIYPKFYNASYDLGRAYIETNDFKNAKIAFEHTYKIDTTNILPLEELTKTSFDLKQKSETEYYGNLYLEKVPNNENIHELLAYIMLINNEKEKANTYAERGLKYFPNNQNLRQILLESSK